MNLGICLLLVLLLVGFGLYIARDSWIHVISHKPTIMLQNGLQLLEHYIVRMLKSRKPIRFLVVSTLDQHERFALTAKNNQVDISLDIVWREEPQTEQAIRQLFQNLEIEPIRDFLTGA